MEADISNEQIFVIILIHDMTLDRTPSVQRGIRRIKRCFLPARARAGERASNAVVHLRSGRYARGKPEDCDQQGHSCHSQGGQGTE